MRTILVADDERDMLKIVEAYLVKAGFQVLVAENGDVALDLFYAHKVDAAVLDWMMPLKSGLEVCKAIKSRSSTKVLMLTAKSENEDELQALVTGADDYLRKPFDPRILIARLEKMLGTEKTETLGDLLVDHEAAKVFKAGQDVQLTKREWALLTCLMENPGMILSRARLLDLVWGLDYEGEERTVDTHVRRLREKIGEDLIQTHRGMGYSLEVNREKTES